MGWETRPKLKAGSLPSTIDGFCYSVTFSIVLQCTKYWTSDSLTEMAVAVQMIHIHYHGKFLSLLDSDDSTLLYTVKVCRETPQIQVVRRQASTAHQPGLCTASFKKLSMDVTLSIHGHRVLLRRPDIFSRTYGFESCSLPGTMLRWEADGALTGDFKLVNMRDDRVLCRFHNKVFSVAEVGSFEMIGVLSEDLKDEVVTSGLAVLVMVQSLNLAGMVLMGSP